MPASRHKVFTRNDRVVEGWYWALRSRELPVGKARPVQLLGKELVLYRGNSGKLVALDAHCPHQGAHLGNGTVRGDLLRCALHGWTFDAAGSCVQSPCQAATPAVQNNSWPIEERHGLIWIYTGKIPRYPVPHVPELLRQSLTAKLGRPIRREGHPHAVLAEPIDTHHTFVADGLPTLPTQQARPLHEHCIVFQGTRPFRPRRWSLKGRLCARLLVLGAGGKLEQSIAFWNGSTSAVTLKTPRAELHFLLALRLAFTGMTEIQPILLTPRRKGLWGALVGWFALKLTAIVAQEFGRLGQLARQNGPLELRTPVRADRPVLELAQHLDSQRVTRWGAGQLPSAQPEPTALPASMKGLRLGRLLRN